MDPNEKIMVNFRVPRRLRDKFAAAAAGRGRSSTAFIREIMELVTSTDAGFFDALVRLAEAHQWAVEQAQLRERRRNIQ
jgi:hypothetical protein